MNQSAPLSDYSLRKCLVLANTFALICIGFGSSACAGSQQAVVSASVQEAKPTPEATTAQIDLPGTTETAATADNHLGRQSDNDEPSSQHFALLVGVSQYYPDRFSPLAGAEPDMVGLAKVLRQRGFSPDNMTLLSNREGATDPRLLPLAYNIRKQLKSFAKRCTDDDVLVVAMAGHGVQPKGNKFYFCPFDADLEDEETLIALDEIYSLLKECPARFKLLLMDACREDSQALNASERTRQTMPGLPAPPVGIATFVSCSQGQLAYERQDGEAAHGVFFQAVVEGLAGAATGEDGTVTLPDLERFVKKKVQRYVADTYQAEQFPVLRNNTAGLFPIVRFTRKDNDLERVRWLLSRDRYDEAEEIVDALITTSPDDGEILAEQSRVITYMAEQSADESRLPEALELAKRAIDRAPNSAMPHVAMANVHRMNKEYEQSLACGARALKCDPNCVLAHIICGMAHYGLGDFDAMFGEAQKAMEIDPEHPEARGLYAAFLFADGQWDAGHAELDRAIAISPDLPTLYFLKGYGYEQQGEHHQAVRQYTSAIRLNDQVPSYFVRRALSLGNSGDYPAAWEDVAAAEKLAPTYFDVTSARAMLLVNQQKWQEALVALNKGLDINPDSPDLLMGRGFAYIYTKQFQLAEKDLQRMVEIKPEAANGHFGLGVVDLFQNRLDEAMVHVQRAIRHDDRSSEAHYMHAAILMKRQQYQKALPPLSRAIELDPKNATYYQQRAMLYQLSGRMAEAQQDNAKFQQLSAE